MTNEPQFNSIQFVDPDEIDEDVLEILKDCRVNAAQIENLYNRYERNDSMRRLIGAEAQRRAEREPDIDERRTLKAIAYVSQDAEGQVLTGMGYTCAANDS